MVVVVMVNIIVECGLWKVGGWRWGIEGDGDD